MADQSMGLAGYLLLQSMKRDEEEEKEEEEEGEEKRILRPPLSSHLIPSHLISFLFLNEEGKEETSLVFARSLQPYILTPRLAS